MVSSESMEMYLETVYILEQAHGHAHGVDIAKKLGVSKPSVTKAMNQLKDKGYVKKESYGSITLTDKGVELSEKVYNRHKTITAYLMDSLGTSYEEAAENACRMEHVITVELLDHIKNYLKNHDIVIKKEEQQC